MSNGIKVRCEDCGSWVEKKPQAKTPKYCSSCRESRQDAWKENLKKDRQRRVRGR